MNKEQAKEYLRTGKVDLRRWYVLGWGDNTGIWTIASGFRRERDARNFMLDVQDAFRIRFGVRCFTLTYKMRGD